MINQQHTQHMRATPWTVNDTDRSGVARQRHAVGSPSCVGCAFVVPPLGEAIYGNTVFWGTYHSRAVNGSARLGTCVEPWRRFTLYGLF